jgi:hypothetical protein
MIDDRLIRLTSSILYLFQSFNPHRLFPPILSLDGGTTMFSEDSVDWRSLIIESIWAQSMCFHLKFLAQIN